MASRSAIPAGGGRRRHVAWGGCEGVRGRGRWRDQTRGRSLSLRRGQTLGAKLRQQALCFGNFLGPKRPRHGIEDGVENAIGMLVKISPNSGHG